jgi:hypothetical protein
MIIRPYLDTDFGQLERIHRNNELPSVCLPDPGNPLFFVRQVIEHEGTPALAAFLKLTCEPFLLVDHTVATPEWRWQALKALNDTVTTSARTYGLEDMTAWVPPGLRKSFGGRLEELGFKESPWGLPFSKVM